jgi:hypothetical protein
MTTIIFAEKINTDIDHLKNKLSETTDIDERKKLERTIESLEDAVVIYRLYSSPKEEITINK